MEHTSDTTILDLIVQPAFCVNDGIISQCNHAAAGRMIETGTPVGDILTTGRQEYAEFTGGCLYLTVSHAGQSWGAAVTRTDRGDIFVLDRPEQPELQAMALAAKELRVPLSSLMLAADRLLPSLSDSNRDQAAALTRSIHQLLRLVSNMSDAQRYSEGQAAHSETVDVCALLEELFSKAAELLARSGITLQYSCPSASIYSLTDAVKLERAVYNLLSNAAKFTPAGGTIDAKLTRHSSRLHLTVTDSGSGIPDSIRPGMFSHYLREAGFEDSRQGIGLGMVIVRSAAAAHGGTVLVEQPDGGGTRITMTMMIDQGSGASLGAPKLWTDYTGERDHCLVELADVLPPEAYKDELA